MQNTPERVLERARALIEADQRASVQLLAQLREERDALKSRDSERLHSVVQQKIQCLQALESNDRERQQLLRGTRKLDWPSYLEKLGLAAEWEQLTVILRECKDLTDINERIVQRTQRSVGRILSVFRGQLQAPSAAVYDARGKTHGCGNSRPFVTA